MSDRSQSPDRPAPAFVAAGSIFSIVLEVINFPVVFGLLLIETVVSPSAFGFSSWQHCFGIAVVIAVVNATVSMVKNFKLFPHGRGEAARSRWIFRELEYFVQLIAVTLVVQVVFFPNFLPTIVSSLILSAAISAFSIALSKPWRPLPDAATIEARRQAIQQRRDAQRRDA